MVTALGDLPISLFPLDPISAFAQQVSAAILPVALRTVGALLFQTPDLTGVSEIRGLAQTAMVAADSMLGLFLLYAGFRLIVSGGTENLYAFKSIVTRVFTGAVLSNTSLLICSTLVQLDNGLVSSLLGADPLAGGWSDLSGRLQTGNLVDGLLGSLLAVAAAVLALFLALIYVARDLGLVVLTVAAPLALITYALPALSEIAQRWWRLYAATLFMQVAHALLVAVGADLVAHPDWLGTPASGVISGLAVLALFYVMARLPFHLYQWVFGQPVSSHPVVVKVVSVAKTAAALALAA